MSFVDTICGHLAAHPSRPFVTEVHGTRLERGYGARLLELVARARGGLRARGVAPGDRVVLLAPNSIRWVAADLAMLAEGLTSVPMYARQEPSELVVMMQDAGATLVVCATEELATAVRSAWPGAPAVLFGELFDAAPVAEPPRQRAPDDVVTLIYTSGTSGEPKGVMTTMANIETMLPLIDGRLTELLGRPGGRDRVFHYLPFCFAGSRFVLWSCLFRANGVMVSTDLNNLQEELKTAAPEWFLNVPALLERVKAGVEKKLLEAARPVRALYEGAIAAWRAERAHLAGGRAPSAGQRLLLAIARRVVFPRILAQIGQELRCLICGSAPLAEETQAWFELIGLPVYQVYGLTETTAIVSMDRPSSRERGGAAKAGRVGHAIEGCRLRLGEGDELQVQGDNVFAGYWNRPEATADAFTEDGWFRTGDQAAIDASGSLAIIGRVKNILVPSSGHNVAPEPIEQRVLESIPGVTQVVLVGHGRPHLTALVTGDALLTANATSIDALRADVARGIDAINETLPHYRRIRGFHLCNEPFSIENGLLTANQKLRRGAIERQYQTAIEGLYR